MAAQTVLPVLVVTMWKQNLSAFSTTSHLRMQNPRLTAPQHSEEMAEPFAFARNNWEIMELLFAFPIKRSSRTTSTYWEGCIDSGGSRMEVFRSAALGSSGETEHGALSRNWFLSPWLFFHKQRDYTKVFKPISHKVRTVYRGRRGLSHKYSQPANNLTVLKVPMQPSWQTT